MNIHEVLKKDAQTAIQRCFKKWGVERTEDKIKELLKGKAQEFMLKRYREIIR